jgi:hypothetical protein
MKGIECCVARGPLQARILQGPPLPHGGETPNPPSPIDGTTGQSPRTCTLPISRPRAIGRSDRAVRRPASYLQGLSMVEAWPTSRHAGLPPDSPTKGWCQYGSRLGGDWSISVVLAERSVDRGGGPRSVQGTDYQVTFKLQNSMGSSGVASIVSQPDTASVWEESRMERPSRSTETRSRSRWRCTWCQADGLPSPGLDRAAFDDPGVGSAPGISIGWPATRI